MKIMAVDDEELALGMLVKSIKKACPEAEVSEFQEVASALEFVQNNPCDIAFLDIEMWGEMNGIQLAGKIKQIAPDINIIFATGYSDYVMSAFSLRASGYIMKPVTAESISEEVKNLRNPVEDKQHDGKLHIHTFGNFEVFYNGVPVYFSRKKSKELLAYLVDRKGASATMAEIASILWEEREYSRTLLKQIHSFLSDITRQFRMLGVDSVVIKGYNSLAINVEEVECDYYDFLKGSVTAINSFRNEYMSNYSWAEFTVGALYKKSK